jgi:ubiquinone/menaquinone biosynthesis C-methylase UbiE
VRRTDYAAIARVYDQNPERRQDEADGDLRDYLESHPAGSYAALDLGCGTGSYLAAQARHLRGYPVSWHGLDRSPEMLAVARGKLRNAALRAGDAASLPYADGMFDVVVVNFAFHHFEDKPAVLDEAVRVLKPGGMLKIRNIAPSRMRRWLVYRYWPETRREDRRRFWPVGRLRRELRGRGLVVRLSVRKRRFRKHLVDLLQDAARRDVSQLAILDEKAYKRGLERIERDARSTGSRRDEIALLTCIGRRTG